MIRFLKKMSVFLIAYLVVAVVFFLLVPAQYPTSYDAAIQDKIDRLEKTESPKIILVGNSNLTFGIVSEEIENAMGMPVVNLGFNKGFGNIFNENIAKRNICEGDLVIICHNNFNDDGKMFNRDEFWFAMENHFDLWDIPGVYVILENAYNLPWYILKATIHYISGRQNDIYRYYRDDLNEYGDFKPEVHASVDPNGDSSPNKVKMPSISETCVKRINALNRYCKERGATLLIAGYPIADTEGRPADEAYEKFQAELERRMECPVISTYTDYIFPVEYFHELALHLTDKGALLRTGQLIKDLSAWRKNEETVQKAN